MVSTGTACDALGWRLAAGGWVQAMCDALATRGVPDVGRCEWAGKRAFERQRQADGSFLRHSFSQALSKKVRSCSASI